MAKRRSAVKRDDRAGPPHVKSLLPRVPERLRAQAERLAALPGVHGVFFRETPAERRAAGQKHAERMLVAHVVAKRPEHQLHPDEIIARAVECPTDVVAVGRPRTLRLDAGDTVVVPGTTRVGSLTVVAQADDGARALLCGHVGLPRVGDATVRTFPSSAAPAMVPLSVVQSDLTQFDAVLVKGDLGSGLDWALAHFPLTPPARTNRHHFATPFETPLPYRKQKMKEGNRVHHFSTTRDHRIDGVVAELPTTTLKLRHGEETIDYDGVVVIASTTDEPFGEPGDSGSLLIDDSNFAWGVVVGASDDGTRAYALTLKPLIDRLGAADAKRFFRI